LKTILFGLLFTTKALIILSSPTNMVPKSNVPVWLFLSSIMYLE
jgi:hypothetical protein